MSDPVDDQYQADAFEGDSGQAAASQAYTFDSPTLPEGVSLNQGVAGATVKPFDDPVAGAQLNADVFQTEMDPGHVAGLDSANASMVSGMLSNTRNALAGAAGDPSAQGPAPLGPQGQQPGQTGQLPPWQSPSASSQLPAWQPGQLDPGPDNPWYMNNTTETPPLRRSGSGGGSDSSGGSWWSSWGGASGGADPTTPFGPPITPWSPPAPQGQWTPPAPPGGTGSVTGPGTGAINDALNWSLTSWGSSGGSSGGGGDHIPTGGPPGPGDDVIPESAYPTAQQGNSGNAFGDSVWSGIPGLETVGQAEAIPQGVNDEGVPLGSLRALGDNTPDAFNTPQQWQAIKNAELFHGAFSGRRNINDHVDEPGLFDDSDPILKASAWY